MTNNAEETVLSATLKALAGMISPGEFMQVIKAHSREEGAKKLLVLAGNVPENERPAVCAPVLQR